MVAAWSVVRRSVSANDLSVTAIQLPTARFPVRRVSHAKWVGELAGRGRNPHRELEDGCQVLRSELKDGEMMTDLQDLISFSPEKSFGIDTFSSFP